MNRSQPSSMAKPSSKTISAARKRIAAGLAAMVGIGTAAITMASCTVDDGLRPRGHTKGAGGLSGEPCIRGATAECHLTVGTNDEILTCLHGERTCVGGTWGPCMGEFESKTMSEHEKAQEWAPGDVRPLGLTDAGPCQTNPCDPYCQDYEEVPAADAGYQVIPTITTVWSSGSFDDLLDGLPPGFADIGVKDLCTTAADCQFDSHCLPTGSNGITCEDGAANCCMAWKPLEYANCAPDLPDVTVGLACEKPDGTRIIPVCNRGEAPIVPPVRIYIFPGNSSQFSQCIPDNDPDICFIPAGSLAISPGRCVEVTSCGLFLPGNDVRTIQVNGPANGLGNLPDNPNYFQECSCENNWTVWKGTNKSPCQPVQIYQANPIVKTLQYQGVCPLGARVQWQYLTWDTTTPLDSNVTWEGRVATTSAGLSSASYVNLGTAQATPLPNTQICSIAGPTGCPLNLFNAFGGAPMANSEHLEVRITMNPTSNQQQGAKVNNWQISYTCPPSQ